MPENAENGIALYFTEDVLRTLFHDLYSIRDLPKPTLQFFRIIAEYVETFDSGGLVQDGRLPVRYVHPDLLELHYAHHSEHGYPVTLYPINLDDCEICQMHKLLVAYNRADT